MVEFAVCLSSLGCQVWILDWSFFAVHGLKHTESVFVSDLGCASLWFSGFTGLALMRDSTWLAHRQISTRSPLG